MPIPKKEYVNREGVTELVSLIKDALDEKLDSDDVNISDGTITIKNQSITPITQQYSLPIAAADALGGIKVGNNLSIDLDGTLNATGGGSSITVDDHIDATSENPVQNKVIKSALDDKLDKTNATISSGEITIQEHQLEPMDDEEVSDLWESIEPTPGSGGSAYILPIASDTILGGIKVGNNLTIDSSTGVLSATGGSYTLPPATNSTLGGIIVGNNLSITEQGVLSATGGGGSYTLPIASANTLGGIKVGNSLTIDNNGVLNTQKVSDVKLLMYSSDKNINTQDEAYTATEACDVICFNYDVNGEASTQTLGSIISTTGTENGSYTNSSGYSNPNRNYSLTIKSISLQVGDTVTFSHGSSHSGAYTQQIHIIIKVQQAYTTISSVYFYAKQDTGISYTENISTTGDYFALATQTKYSTTFGNLSSISIGVGNPDISVNNNASAITNKVALFTGGIESGESISFSTTAGDYYETQTAMIISLS